MFGYNSLGTSKKHTDLEINKLPAQPAKSLFNKSTITNGKYIKYTDGNYGTNADYVASDYIPVTAGSEYAISGTGTYCEQFAFYDANKVFVSGNAGGSKNTPWGFKFTVPAGCTYVRLSVKVVNLDVYKIEKSRNVLVVDQKGEGFKTVSGAVSEAKDSLSNPVTIIIMPGTYIEKVNLLGRYISLVGANKATCIIRYDDGNYGNYPVDAWTYNHLKNLTIISTHDNGQPITGLPAYAVHLDYNGGSYTAENVCMIENCKLISHQHAALGIGLQNLQTVRLENCELYNLLTDADAFNYNGGALYCHNKQADGATGQKLIVANCIVKSLKEDALVIEDANHRAGGGYGDAQDTVVTFYNNIVYSGSLGLACTRFDAPLDTGKLSGYISLSADSFGNNITGINTP